MSTGFQSDAFQDAPLAFQILLPGGAVWPDAADVRLGVTYGPTGVEYTGTLVVTGGTANLILARRR